jgi:hypothetical protein
MNNFSKPEIKQLLERTGATAALILIKMLLKLMPAILALWVSRLLPRLRDVYAADRSFTGFDLPLPTSLVRIRQDMTDLMRNIEKSEVKLNGDDDVLEHSLQITLQSTSLPDFAPKDVSDPVRWHVETDAPQLKKGKCSA